MSARRRAVLVLATAAVYFGVAKLSLVFAIPPGFASAVWPPAGIAAAALLLGGKSLWLGVWLGLTAANLTVQASVAAPFAIGAGGALEALFIAWGVERYIGRPDALFTGAANVFRFVGLAFAGAAISAAIANGTLFAAGAVGGEHWFLNWLTWWLGDAMGVLLVTPLVLAVASRRGAVDTPARAIELGIALGALLGVTGLVFFDSPWSQAAESMAFLLLPPIVWLAARFDAVEVTAAAAATCALAMYATVNGQGPFVSASLNESLLVQQAFVCTISVVGLALGVAISELRRAHAELEIIVNLASHDLHEPVRNTIGYVDLLERRYGPRLDADAREFLGYMAAGAVRMQKLIADLQGLSRAGQAARHPQPVDAGAALDVALRNLAAQLEKTRALVTRDALPMVVAEAPLLEQLFENLIGNALKFRSEEPPRVHVSAIRRGAQWVLSVRDNGIGIDPRDHARIFRMFERLHGRGSGGGAGVGLALCARIVERYGGRLWVESSTMAGATFYFTLAGDGRR